MAREIKADSALSAYWLERICIIKSRENSPDKLDSRLIIQSTLHLDMLLKFLLDVKEFVDAAREHMDQFDGPVPSQSK